jgi:hypothetical protein
MISQVFKAHLLHQFAAVEESKFYISAWSKVAQETLINNTTVNSARTRKDIHIIPLSG